MKQLRNNPNKASIQKGWQALAFCLRSFAPESIENYLDSFIREYAPYPKQYLVLMYGTLLFDKTPVLSKAEIEHMIK